MSSAARCSQTSSRARSTRATAGSSRASPATPLGPTRTSATLATEDFLGCLSKEGIEKVGSSLRVLPRPRAKDTRAEVIKRASGTTYVHPAALFALTEAEITLHAEAPRDYSWGNDDPGDDDEGEVGDVSEGSVSSESDDDVIAEHERGDEVAVEENARSRRRDRRRASRDARSLSPRAAQTRHGGLIPRPQRLVQNVSAERRSMDRRSPLLVRTLR